MGFRIVLAPIKVFYPESSLGMLAIPSGTFQMGSAVVGGTAVPVHSVTISTPFWMARHEVTQAQFQALMGSNPSSFQGPGHPDAPSRPVERVTWAEAVAYCSALTAQEAAAGRVPVGYQYRLPTEAEWEYCCRASTTTEWSTGSSLTAAQANIENVIARTVACGRYGSNPWGLFDMHGNVWEWCLDSWDGTANYSSGAVSDPYVTTGHVKLHRGGGYARIANDCRSALRNASPSTNRSSDIGFRIVLAPVLVP